MKELKETVTTLEIEQIAPQQGIAEMCEFLFGNYAMISDAQKCNYIIKISEDVSIDYFSVPALPSYVDVVYKDKCYCVSQNDALFNHERINENIRILLTGE